MLARGVGVGLTLIGLAGIGLAAGKPDTGSDLGFIAAALEARPRAGEPSARTRAEPAPPDAAPGPDHPVEQHSPEPTPAGAGGTPATTAPERRDPCAPARLAAAPGAAAAPPATPKVALNRASVAELVRLPGVGPKRAAAIVQLRERLGGFRRPTDLLRVRGIGPRALERLLPHVVIDDPAGADAVSREPRSGARGGAVDSGAR